MKHLLITILGPTASGKTTLAATVAAQLDGEVISADSRQVYRGMNIGTGKDFEDYSIDGKVVPYHLIDIADSGEEYNIFRYRQDFFKVFAEITSRGKIPLLCGGSGMYLESVLQGYDIPDVPENQKLRNTLAALTDTELVTMLGTMKKLHATSDTSDRQRIIRAIEIEVFRPKQQVTQDETFVPESVIFGLHWPRELLKMRITDRLEFRLQHGMVQEVEHLLQTGVPAPQLISYGLEYKYVTKYILGELTYSEMFERLNTAIHQFSKRQMTWFRRMERKGFEIQWLDGRDGTVSNAGRVIELYKRVIEAAQTGSEF